MKKIVILGGGITGLTLAKELSDEYKGRVVLIEKEPVVGGLAVTLSKNGLFFDLGSHRIHSDYPKKIFNYLTKTIGVKTMKMPRRGLLYFKGKFLQYPPNIANFLQVITLKKILQFIGSYVKKFFLPPSKNKEITYQEVMIKAVGKKIYMTFYKDFAKKLWGLHPKEISGEGTRRRNTFLNLRSLQKGILGRNKYFFYPRNGIGEIADRLEAKILLNKAKIIKGAETKSLLLDKGKVSKVIVRDSAGKTHEIETDMVVSTIPIDALFGLAYGHEAQASSLKWRGIRIMYLHLKESLERENETFYFPELTIKFGRVSDISKFSPYLNPSLKGTLLTVEIPCSPKEELWDMKDDELVKICLQDLVKAGILKKDSGVLSGFSIKLEKAYPIYKIGWREKFYQIYNKLREIEGLFTIGRKGLFLHCNIDHCIIQALETADFISRTIKGRQEVPWETVRESFMHFSARD